MPDTIQDLENKRLDQQSDSEKHQIEPETRNQSTKDDISPTSRSSNIDGYPEGGSRAWLVAMGTGGVLFCTLGYTNSFGVFQAYYMLYILRDETPDRIAWIGSIQGFLIFAMGAIGGPLFDRFGANVIRPAAILYLFAIMMTSLCETYWQFMLVQGLLTGIGNGLVMFPSMSATAQYFHKNRGAAMGIAIAGSSLGGVVFPIALGKMLNGSNLGLGWSVRICGFIMLPFLVFSCVVIKARLPPRSSKFLLFSAFNMPMYNLLIAASFCLFVGMFVPMFFLPTYAIDQGVESSLASYLAAMLNAGSIPGRIIPGLLADKLGRLNMLFAAGLSSTIMIFCWSKLIGTAGIIAYAVVFGFCSGAIISGSSVAITLCPKDPKDIGTYMGMGMTLASTAALLGPPVTGSLLDRYGNFLQASIFSGAFCAGGSILVLLAKMKSEKGIFGRM